MIRRTIRTDLLATAIAACVGGSEPSGAPVFGVGDDACGATVLTNDIDDEPKLREGVDCVFRRVDARQPAVWDLPIPTVEGDPILYRFDTDGNQITITEDATRDEFGPGEAVVRVCDSIEDAGFIVQGVDCIESDGAAFALPAGSWSP